MASMLSVIDDPSREAHTRRVGPLTPFVGQSHNAAAESAIGLFKTELIRKRGPWRGLDDVELATLEWVDWFNHRRLHSFCQDVPPAEYEDHYHREQARAEHLSRGEPSLH